MFNCILKTRKFLFPWTQIWKTAVDMNFKLFVEATIYEPIIMLMPLAWWCHQTKKIFVCVNAECFCLFDKLLLKWISSFFVEGTIYEPIIMLTPLTWWHHQSKKIFVCVNAECFCLFGKLLLTWISGFFMEATICEAVIMSIPLARWRRQSKNIFVSVNAECYGSNHLWAYNHVDVSCVMRSLE